MIIHISGDIGSGKTILGNKIKELFGDQVAVYDTDDFANPHNDNGKFLFKMHSEGISMEKVKKIWKKIMQNSIKDIAKKNKNKLIILTGILNNLSLDGTFFPVKADYKFILNVPLGEIIKRYYLRLQKVNDQYWDLVVANKYFISSSDTIIERHNAIQKWHEDNGYVLKTDVEIVDFIRKLLLK